MIASCVMPGKPVGMRMRAAALSVAVLASLFGGTDAGVCPTGLLVERARNLSALLTRRCVEDAEVSQGQMCALEKAGYVCGYATCDTGEWLPRLPPDYDLQGLPGCTDISQPVDVWLRWIGDVPDPEPFRQAILSSLQPVGVTRVSSATVLQSGYELELGVRSTTGTHTQWSLSQAVQARLDALIADGTSQLSRAYGGGNARAQARPVDVPTPFPPPAPTRPEEAVGFPWLFLLLPAAGTAVLLLILLLWRLRVRIAEDKAYQLESEALEAQEQAQVQDQARAAAANKEAGLGLGAAPGGASQRIRAVSFERQPAAPQSYRAPTQVLDPVLVPLMCPTSSLSPYGNGYGRGPVVERETV